MKQLSDFDLHKMIGEDFSPDESSVKKQVRSELKLSRLITEEKSIPEHFTLDLHQKTEEQAWAEINDLINSGIKSAKIITGASGILKPKFQDWITNGILADKIRSWKAINNGCFEIFIKKVKSD